ncbi:MAG: 4Fe-4S dicluster domain-containing protein [Thermoanaerobacteraceae bacterium]|nr:4Fe-4S dicluster domain-containing protein [Thermoanaerobacteraceae bacterium]
MAKGVLVDLTKCIGCKGCQTACKQWNDLPATIPDFDNNLTYPADTDAYNYTTVLHRVVEKEDGQETLRFAKRQCMHCQEPTCVTVCFSRALVKSPEGAIVYDEEKCVGCRYCIIACPFQVPKYEWNDALKPVVSKCQFCFDPRGKHDRIGHGMEPACVNACPSRALKFGDRDELLKEARQRISSDSKYVNHIYGEKEAGGTNWLYISDVPFEKLGFRTDVSQTPLPYYVHDYLKWTPTVFLGGGALFAALHFYTKRRNEVARAVEKEEVAE